MERDNRRIFVGLINLGIVVCSCALEESGPGAQQRPFGQRNHHCPAAEREDEERPRTQGLGGMGMACLKGSQMGMASMALA